MRVFDVARQCRIGRVGLVCLALVLGGVVLPSVAVASDGATGSFQVLGLQNGAMSLSITVDPGSGACQSLNGKTNCDWSAYVEPVSYPPVGVCTMYPSADPSGALESHANAAPQTAQESMVTNVVSGECVLNLYYTDGAGQAQILAQELYRFPGPTATFSFSAFPEMPLGGGNWSVPATVTLSEPICPSSGGCSWFGFVITEPSGVGCPLTLAPGSGPTPLWTSPTLDAPGTESAEVSLAWNWNTSPSGFDWCGYINGPAAATTGAGLVGESPDTSAPPVPMPPPASINSSRPAHKPKYTMTLSDLPSWMRAVAVDNFYRARRTTRLAAFHVTDCRRQHDGRFRCRVSWRKHPYAFAGTVTVGDLDPTTGHFGFGLAIVRGDQATGTRKRIHVPYRSP